MGQQDKILQQGHRQSWTLRASPGAEVGQGAVQGGTSASLKHPQTLTEDLHFFPLVFYFNKRRPNSISVGLIRIMFFLGRMFTKSQCALKWANTTT